MGVYNDIVLEIAKRINNGYSDLGLKSLQISSKPERLQPDMTPYIQIIPAPGFISEDYGRAVQNKQKDGTLNMSVVFDIPINDRDGNYIIAGTNINDNSGMLSNNGTIEFIEKLLDYINTDLSGELNPQTTNSSLSIAISVNNLEKSDLTASGDVSLSITSNRFVINNRQNK